MDFITDNYVWFIVGGIILVMALIGYIAERTDFGRKESTKKEKKEKIEKTNKEAVVAPPVQPIEEVPVVTDADNLIFGQDASLNDEVALNPNVDETTVAGINEDLTVPLDPTSDVEAVEETPVIDEELMAPLVSEDLNAPLEEPNETINDINLEPVATETDSAVETDEVNEIQSNDLFNETPAGIEEVIPEEPVALENETSVADDIQVDDDNTKTNIELPNIDTLKENDPDDEDVWKF
jgi:hypothetical protein